MSSLLKQGQVVRTHTATTACRAKLMLLLLNRSCQRPRMRLGGTRALFEEEFLLKQCSGQNSIYRPFSDFAFLAVTRCKQVRNVLQLFLYNGQVSSHGSVFV